MKKTLKYLVVALLGVTIFTGCTERITDFTIISTKNIDLSDVAKMKRGSERVEGKDSIYIILFIPTGIKPDLKEAIDKALEKVPGAVALVDGVVSYTHFYFLIGESSFTVEGTPLIDPKLVSQLPSRYMISTYNKKTKDFEIKYVSKSEYQKYKAKLKGKELKRVL